MTSTMRTFPVVVAAALLLFLHGVTGQECIADGSLCDKHERCPVWKEEGECIRSKKYMNEHCPASCSITLDHKESDNHEECEDKHSRCVLWAEAGECEENADNMKKYCPKACDFCGQGGDEVEKSAQTMDANDDVTELLQKTIDFGVMQAAEGSDKLQTLDIVRASVDYMENEIHNLPEKVVETCLNRNHLCAFWAAIGECDNNPAFMLTNCAPSCKTCHLIDMETRCPPLEDAKPALRPGQLNKMFENLVTTAPGNRTLTSDERKELEAKRWPVFTAHVLSRPTGSVDDPLTRATDLKSHPWVVYLENFLTPEECQILIDLGHKQGYQRSKDVGSKQNFDGSFEAVESKGRTSENAWCSHHAGCRNDTTVQNIHDRIGRVLGIDPKNSEDLQLLRYEKNQFYNSHHDYIENQRDRQCGPRILTFFLYLTDVEAGGGTRFDTLDITVTPKVGRALLWPSVFNSSPMDKDGRTTHEALPVEKGTKFAANAWIHQFDYLGPQSRGCN